MNTVPAKNELSLAITLLFLLGLVWLISAENVSIAHVLPLLMFRFVVIKWILRDKNKPSRLLGFFIKTFTLILIATSVVYFVVWLGITAPHTYSVYPIHAIVETGMIFIFAISLLLVAISIIIYGIYKIKLKAWEIFFSSWYISLVAPFGIASIYFMLWPIPYTPPSEEIYPPPPGSASLGAGIDTFLTFITLSFLSAAICTEVYLKFKKKSLLHKPLMQLQIKML